MADLGHQRVFDLDAIEAELKARGTGCVQFDRPIQDTLEILKLDGAREMVAGPSIRREDYLARVREMCARWGERFTVRFYAHYGEVFDATVLLEFPEIRSLMVNSIYGAVENLEAIGELPHLTCLHVGVFELEDKRLLEHLPISSLTELTIEETRTKALDLAPLARARALRRLRLFGHKKHIEAVGELGGLEEFVFNPAKNNPLGFLNGLVSLRSLKFVLGGGDTIEDIVDLPALEEMAFTMMRGLAELGDLQRFHNLKRLFMQDQPQVERIRMGAKNKRLRHLWFYNCPKLATLEGLDALPALESLRAVITAMTLDRMELPKSLTHLALYSAKAREEPEERAMIEALGLIPEDHPDMPFFYK